MWELLNVLLASEAELVGNPCGGSKLLKPGVTAVVWASTNLY